MINHILYVILPTVSFLVALYIFMQKKQQEQQKKQQEQYAKQINVIKASFKTTIELLSFQNIIRPNHVNNFYAIINNYFIDQPITAENLARMERLANRISITVIKEVNLAHTEADNEWLRKKMLNFILMLPNNGKEYTQNFYQKRIKSMLQGLHITRSHFVQRQSHTQAQAQAQAA